MQQESPRDDSRQAVEADVADDTAVDTEAVAAWIAETIAETDAAGESDGASESTETGETDDSARKRLDAAGSANRLVDVLASHLAGAASLGSGPREGDSPDGRVAPSQSPTSTHSSPSQPSTPTHSSSGDDEQSDASSQPVDFSVDDATASELAGLASELQELRSAIENAAESRQSSSADRADEARAAESESEFVWIGSVEPGQSSPVESPTTGALAERAESLEARVVAIEAALDGVSLPSLEAAVEQQHSDHADFEARLESELDSIEAVFEGLLARIDSLDSRLDGIDEARQRALEPIEDRLESQDALIGLIQEALRHGVTDAACHNCGQAVEVSLLETPHCPSCGRRFTRVTDGGWLPFSTATLRTAPTGSLGARPSQSGQPGQSR